MATIRIEKKRGGGIFKADYKIPHIVAGTKVQQFIKETLTCISVKGVQKCAFIKDKDIFTDLTQLYQEMETNQFLFNLYKYMHKSYKEIDGTVREDNILILFNLAFRIACATLNTQNPATRFSYWDKRIEDYFFRIHEFSVTWVMVYCILNEEKEKTQFMELFLDDLKTDIWFESEKELFDSIKHTTPDKVDHMQESETTTSKRNHHSATRRATPEPPSAPTDKASHEVPKAVEKAFKNRVWSDFCRSGIKELYDDNCVRGGEIEYSQLAALEYALSSVLFKKKKHKAFGDALIAWEIMDGHVFNVSSLRSAYSRLDGKWEETNSEYLLQKLKKNKIVE